MALQFEDRLCEKTLGKWVGGLASLNLSFWDIDGAENDQSAQQVRFAKSGLVRARGGGGQPAITEKPRR